MHDLTEGHVPMALPVAYGWTKYSLNHSPNSTIDN